MAKMGWIKKRGETKVVKENKSLTEGNIGKTLVSFALPFLIANFIQALYGAVDMAVVGWFSNAAGISAVSTGTSVIQIITCIITGLTMGVTILIAQYRGAGKDKDTVETIGTMFTFFTGIAIALTILMFLITGPVLRLLQTPDAAFAGATQYVLICSGGIVFIFGYNAISAMLRGFGDSKSPLLFIAIACVINIIFDIVLVGGFHMGPAGAAIATVFSQGVSMVIAIFYLNRRDFIFQFRRENLKLKAEKAKRLLRIGLPVSLQETTVHISFMFITAIINQMGVIASAAVGIANKFEAFAMLPATAFSGAIAAIAAQNMGAGKPERAKKSLNVAMGMAFICSVFFFAWAQLAPASVMQLFKADPEVTAAGVQYLRSFSFDFMLVAFGFTMNGFLNGCGKTGFAMANGVAASLFIRLPLAFICSRAFAGNLIGVGMAAPIATACSVTVALIYISTGRWKKAKA